MNIDAQQESGEEGGGRVGDVAVKKRIEGESEAEVGVRGGKRDGMGDAYVL